MKHILKQACGAAAVIAMSFFTVQAAQADDDLQFYEGNGCSQDPLFSYNSHRRVENNCKKSGNCKGNNDEARSVRIMKSVRPGTKITVWDNPDGKTNDDWTRITIYDNKFIPPEGYCLRTFEQNFANPFQNYGILVEYNRKNGLDGKISRIKIH